MAEKSDTGKKLLTPIAVFAGIVEVAGLIVLPSYDPAIQNLFLWFLMTFPVFVVLLLFAAMNFNPRTQHHASGFLVDADRESMSNLLPASEENAGKLEAGSGDALTTGMPGFTKLADELTTRHHG